MKISNVIITSASQMDVTVNICEQNRPNSGLTL